MRAMTIATAVSLTGCNAILGIPDPEREAAPDAGSPLGHCSHDAPFGEPSLVPGIATPAGERTAWLDIDERTIVFSRDVPGRYGDLFVASRDHRGLAFGPATPLAAANSEDDEYRAALSGDGATLYFDRQVGGAGPAPRYSLFHAVRGAGGELGAPTPMDGLNEAGHDLEPFPTDHEIYFASTRGGIAARLWRAPRTERGFGPAVPVPAGHGRGSAEIPVPSADGLALYFCPLERSASNDSSDIWVSLRADRDQPFETAMEIGSLRTDGKESPSWLSPDNCRLYFGADRDGQFDIWVAERPPAT